MNKDVINKFLDFILKDTRQHMTGGGGFAVIGKDNTSEINYMVYGGKLQSLTVLGNFFSLVLGYIPDDPKLILKCIINKIESKYDVKVESALTFYYKGETMMELRYKPQ